METLLQKLFISISGLAFTALGARLVLKYLNGLPLDKWYALCRQAGQLASHYGNMKFHQPFYEPLETWAEKFLIKSLQSFFEGTDSDDEKEDQSELPPPVV